MEEYAQAAVDAALAAGARYADARVMISQTESMAAQNAVVERLQQDERAGLGVRALVGSSWGFFATPTLTRASVEDAGRRAADIAKASGLVAGPALSLAAAGGEGPRVASWSSGCDEDPLSVPLSEKGDLMVAVTKTMHDAGVQIAQASYSIWDTRKWFVSSEGHRIDQHIRECGAWSSRDGCGRPRDPAPVLPRRPRAVRHPGLGDRPRARPAGHGASAGRRGAGAAARAGLPERRDDADPGRQPDGAAAARVGRPRDRARPHPRLGGGVRRYELARPRRRWGR